MIIFNLFCPKREETKKVFMQNFGNDTSTLKYSAGLAVAILLYCVCYYLISL